MQQLERPPGRLNASALLEGLGRMLPAGSEQGGLQRVLARVGEAGEACAGGSCPRLPARRLASPPLPIPALHPPLPPPQSHLMARPAPPTEATYQQRSWSSKTTSLLGG